MEKVVVLGATGNLGTQTLEVLKRFRKDFKVVGLSANKNKKLLLKQASLFNVPQKNIVLTCKDGKEKTNNLAKLKEANIVINVLSGIAGIESTKTALINNKTVILGNKESLVAEGEKIMKIAKSGKLIPLDSEHNAIFEIIQNNPDKKIKKIILPCSGGPFLRTKKSELRNMTSEKALSHPRWNMGAKISIESATLINKGLEIIEAHYLFNLPLEKIDIKIHPECEMHGIVEFEDKILAYFSKPDMKDHIENALLYALGKKSKSNDKIKEIKNITLKNPDHNKLPGIKVVINYFKRNHKNMKSFLKKEEKVINQFIENKIQFPQIFSLLKE